MLNQEIENTLCCLCRQKPITWSVHLPWIYYSHNSHISSVTGLSPFKVSLGYQPPLLPASCPDPVVPSARARLLGIRRVWDQTHSVLQRTSAQNKALADKKRRPAPTCSPGQLVWLSAKNLPLKSKPRKLGPHFLGLFPIKKVINLSAFKLKIPSHHGAVYCSLSRPTIPPTKTREQSTSTPANFRTYRIPLTSSESSSSQIFSKLLSLTKPTFILTYL